MPVAAHQETKRAAASDDAIEQSSMDSRLPHYRRGGTKHLLPRRESRAAEPPRPRQWLRLARHVRGNLAPADEAFYEI